MKRQNMFMGRDGFYWFQGVVEDRNDPMKLGRVRVRILGLHTDNKEKIPTDDLPWAYPMQPITSAAMNGIGTTPLGPVEGTWVFGFFRDGEFAQEPVIVGTFGGIPQTSPDTSKGFNDPKGKYPKSDYLKEPDTNRLARNQTIDKTIVVSKDNSRVKSIDIANTSSDWDEPESAYNSTYPFNHVRESESGHFHEIDDSLGGERIHWYHRKGTFEEIDANGTKVLKVVGNNYEVYLRDNNAYVVGNLNITTDGNCRILAKNNAEIEVYGDANINVGGDVVQKVGGDYKIGVGGNYSLFASNINLVATTGNINQYANIINLEAIKVVTKLKTFVPSSIGIYTNIPKGDPDFDELVTPSLKNSLLYTIDGPDAVFTPEEELAAVALDIFKDSTKETETPKEIVTTPSIKTIEPKLTGCLNSKGATSYKNYTSNFPLDLKLSDNFTLGMVSVNALAATRKHYVAAQWGWTGPDIVCNLEAVCLNILEPVKQKYPNMQVNSGFRLTGSSSVTTGHSQHEDGFAVDIYIKNFNRQQLYEACLWIKDNILYDQLIMEWLTPKGWIHISYNRLAANLQRKMLLTAVASGGKTKYLNGIRLY